MKISLFTPTHNTRWLQELYNSILDQTYDNWEWVILYNGDTTKIGFNDPRVKEVIMKGKVDNISLVKSISCQHCTGDILFEMEHDDLLMPTALQEVYDAFQDPDVGMVYSNAIHAGWDGTNLTKIEMNPDELNKSHREVTCKDMVLNEIISPSPNPLSLSSIFHLRAYRKSVYDETGGYDVEMSAVDDVDLTHRMYLVTTIKHIDKGLYIFRHHNDNAFINKRWETEDGMGRIYDKYIERIVDKWCNHNNLNFIELGESDNAKEGYITLYSKNANVLCNLNEKWPLDDSTVGCLRAFDVFQKLKDPMFTMKELQRVLVPGGMAIIQVPSTDGRGAWQDPTNISYWNQNSFWMYIDEKFAKSIDTPVRFQSTKLTTHSNDNQLHWATAHLVNLKGDYKPIGNIFI